jgi:hypothetical protein
MFREMLKPFTWHPVKFSDGKYAARRFSILGYEYMDLGVNNRSKRTGEVFSWRLQDGLSYDCKVDSLQHVLAKIQEEKNYKHPKLPSKDNGTALTDQEITFDVLKE